MTNEQAIQILKQYLDMDSEVKSEYLEAQRMAIKALEQGDILDKIRAEIEELKNAPPCFDDMFEYNYAVDDVLAIIDKYKAESEDKK